jgi:mitogen-activated protein kinase kinase kinase
MIEEHKILRIGIEKIKKGKVIGKGSQSNVYLGEFDGRVVAIKELIKYDIKCIIHELAIISKLESENVPSFYGVVVDKERNNISYVTEFIIGKPLDELNVKAMPNAIKVHITKQLAKIISLIHSCNCVHRDLKAENVMIDASWKVYIIDFGISKVLTPDENIKTRAKGTMNYLAPEIFDVTETDEKGLITSVITKAVDVWAFCCVISFIFSGEIPWGKKKASVIQVKLTKKETLPIPDSLKDEKIREIIKAGTIPDPEKRMNMEEISALCDSLPDEKEEGVKDSPTDFAEKKPIV